MDEALNGVFDDAFDIMPDEYWQEIQELANAIRSRVQKRLIERGVIKDNSERRLQMLSEHQQEMASRLQPGMATTPVDSLHGNPAETESL